MADSTLLTETKASIPSPVFACAMSDVQGRTLPQAIAHRGYKAAFPENTMMAFEGALAVGAHAIETDIHVSKDRVVVLSHDASLKRCFGRPEKIIDCDWDLLSTLRTLKAPHPPMPRLKDLLDYLAAPGREDVWLLLDIKLDNDPEEVIRLIAQTVNAVKPSRAWEERVLLGCWAAKYVPLCTKYLPGFPITYIGFSIRYARQFLEVPNASFNMLRKAMVGPKGTQFLKDCRKANRAVFVWTVNDENWMLWSIKQGFDGVITDDPKKYLEVCKDYDEDAPLRLRLKDYVAAVWFNFVILIFDFIFRFRYGYMEERRVEGQGNGQGNGKPKKIDSERGVV